MRLAEGIVIDKEKTFGTLLFSAMRREVFERDEEGNPTTNLKERTYDLKSKTAGMMIQVSIPASVEEKKIDYDAEVELVNPVVDTVANATYRGAEVNWYIKAEDIVLKKGNGTTAVKEQPKKAEENHKIG